MADDTELTEAQQKALAKLKVRWDERKDKRDAECAAAWALPDEAARRPAYDAAKASWEQDKAALLVEEAAIRAS